VAVVSSAPAPTVDVGDTVFDGGDASTSSFTDTLDGGDASTSTFDLIVSGGTA
jgi:hypothetical protein